MTQHPTSSTPQKTTPRGRTFDPYTFAADLNIEVIHRRIRTANELWLPDRSLIVIRSGLSAGHDRAVLTHGLGHAVLGHADDRPKFELAADRWAADQLIHPDELRALGPDATWHEIALEFGVTRRLLDVWLEDHERVDPVLRR